MCDDARSRILNAAGPIFASKGFQRSTVREICQAAEVNVASVNYYFGDKQKLYIEAVKLANRLRASQAPMPVMSPEMSPESRLYAFIGTLVKRMVGIDENTWQARLMMREMLQPTAACREIVEAHLRPEFQVLLDILRELLPENAPEHVSYQVGFSVVGQCLFYRVAGDVVRFIVPPEQIDEHYAVEQLTDHIYRMSIAALTGAVPDFTRSPLSHVG
jgi:AcrR family transcriptional regulator